MTMNKKGRTKLTEECGELVTILAKIDAFGSLEEHWDGKGSLKVRLEDEIADVKAACVFVMDKLDLDAGRIGSRQQYKQTLFGYWDKGGKETSIPWPDKFGTIDISEPAVEADVCETCKHSISYHREPNDGEPICDGDPGYDSDCFCSQFKPKAPAEAVDRERLLEAARTFHSVLTVDAGWPSTVELMADFALETLTKHKEGIKDGQRRIAADKIRVTRRGKQDDQLAQIAARYYHKWIDAGTSDAVIFGVMAEFANCVNGDYIDKLSDEVK